MAPEDDRLSYDILKDDLNIILNKFNRFEKNYLILIGFTIFFIFFFCFPYIQLKFSIYSLFPLERELKILQDNEDIIQKNIVNTNDLQNSTKLTYLQDFHTRVHSIITLLIDLSKNEFKENILNNQLQEFRDRANVSAFGFHNYVWNTVSPTKSIDDLNNKLKDLETVRTDIVRFINNETIENVNQTERFITPIENLETPFGKILLNFTFLLIIFPLGISVGFFIVILQYSDIIKHLTKCKTKYDINSDNNNISNKWEFLKDRLPSLFDPNINKKVITTISIPVVIYIISVIIVYYSVFFVGLEGINEISRNITIIFLILSGIMIIGGFIYTLKEWAQL